MADDPRFASLETRLSNDIRTLRREQDTLARRVDDLRARRDREADREVERLTQRMAAAEGQVKALADQHGAAVRELRGEALVLGRTLSEQRQRLHEADTDRKGLERRLGTLDGALRGFQGALRGIGDRFPKNARTSAEEGHLHALIPQAGAGTPTHVAKEGTWYWDTTNNLGYVNSDGAATWVLRGNNHNILSATHSDAAGALSVSEGALIIGNATPAWSRLVKSTPGAGLRNVLGMDATENQATWKALLDSTNPAAVADSAAPGTSLVAARRDHVHAFPTATRTIIAGPGGLMPTISNGCAAPTDYETATNKVNYAGLAFDATSVEYAAGALPLPDNYDGGTFTAKFYWTAASGSGGVRWAIDLLSRADDEAIDTAYGTAVGVSDTLLAAGDEHVTAATAAITAAGTPAGGEKLYIRVSRLTGHVDDTLAVDAVLTGIKIEYSTNAFSD